MTFVVEQKGEAMADLIDRQAAIDAISYSEIAYYPGDYDSEVLRQDSVVKAAILSIAPIDAEPEVIRCKDCKYYEIVQLTKSGKDDKRCKPSVCVKGKYAVGRNENWFCADAERRTDG